MGDVWSKTPGGDQESAKLLRSMGFQSLISRTLGVLKCHCRSGALSASEPLHSSRPEAFS